MINEKALTILQTRLEYKRKYNRSNAILAFISVLVSIGALVILYGWTTEGLKTAYNTYLVAIDAIIGGISIIMSARLIGTLFTRVEPQECCFATVKAVEYNSEILRDEYIVDLDDDSVMSANQRARDLAREYNYNKAYGYNVGDTVIYFTDYDNKSWVTYAKEGQTFLERLEEAKEYIAHTRTGSGIIVAVLGIVFAAIYYIFKYSAGVDSTATSTHTILDITSGGSVFFIIIGLYFMISGVVYDK